MRFATIIIAALSLGSVALAAPSKDTGEETTKDVDASKAEPGTNELHDYGYGDGYRHGHHDGYDGYRHRHHGYGYDYEKRLEVPELSKRGGSEDYDYGYHRHNDGGYRHDGHGRHHYGYGGYDY